MHQILGRALKIEIEHLKKVFTPYNNYPKKVFDDIIEEKSNKFHRTTNDGIHEESAEELSVVTLAVPYGGKEREQLMKKLKK